MEEERSGRMGSSSPFFFFEKYTVNEGEGQEESVLYNKARLGMWITENQILI